MVSIDPPVRMMSVVWAGAAANSKGANAQSSPYFKRIILSPKTLLADYRLQIPGWQAIPSCKEK
jgi:hypothetical protein